jgi:hypothetical protein
MDDDSVRRAADCIEDIALQAVQRHVARVETVLRQLVNVHGVPLESLSYEHRPESSVERLLCGDVLVCEVRRIYSAEAITVRYELYPGGRPDGWPELSLE